MVRGWGKVAGWHIVALRHVRGHMSVIVEILGMRISKIGTSYGISSDTGSIFRIAGRYLASGAHYSPRPKTIVLAALSVILLSTAVGAQQAGDNVGNAEGPAKTLVLPKVGQNAPQGLTPVNQDIQPVKVTRINANIELKLAQLVVPNLRSAKINTTQDSQEIPPETVTGFIPDIELQLSQLVAPIMTNANINTDTAYQPTVPLGRTNGVQIGFAQAEDGQGPFRVAQVRPSQSTGEITGDQTGNPPGNPQVEMRVPETVTNDLDLALGQRSVYSDLRSLQDRITEAQQPVANISSRFSTQSNDLDIYQEEIAQDIFFSEGASRLRPGLQYLSYIPNTGNGRI
jgi:hypothetical protein